MLLRLPANFLSILDGRLNLIENKIYKEIVVNIPIHNSGSIAINEIASK